MCVVLVMPGPWEQKPLWAAVNQFRPEERSERSCHLPVSSLLMLLLSEDVVPVCEKSRLEQTESFGLRWLTSTAGIV